LRRPRPDTNREHPKPGDASPAEKEMIIEAARRATNCNPRFFPDEDDGTDDDSDKISEYGADDGAGGDSVRLYSSP
jgi:hypothetical protein